MGPPRTSSLSVWFQMAAAVLVLSGIQGDLVAAKGEGSPNAPVARAVRLSGEVIIDGRLDEAAWQEAPSIGGLTQRFPAEGQPATQPSEIRILFDDERLIIGARLLDREPERLVAMAMKEDSELFLDDAFAVFIDTFMDRRNGFFFETNPLGARTDALIFDEGRNNSFDWDGVWEVEARVTGTGWEMEMEIPFRTLNFDPDEVNPWGIQFRRIIRRNAEDAWWSPIPRNEGPFRMSRAGTLEGLSGIRHGSKWEIKPYALGSVKERPTLNEDEVGSQGDAGLDVRYAVTPNLSAIFTVNTDFAETEVDSQQVNTTRFPLFFPEKREFFLASKGYFDFGFSQGGPGGPSVVPFFSRRIGLGEAEINGETITTPIPIIGGAKVAGRMGRYNLGFLSAVTDSEGLSPRTTYGALRVSRDILTRSNWGIMAVTKNPSGRDDPFDPNDTLAGNHSNQTYGADLNFSVLENLKFGGSYILTETPGVTQSQRMGQGYVEWSNNAWEMSLDHSDIGAAFNPEVGFVRRRGIETTGTRLAWNWRSATAVFRRIEPHYRAGYTADQDHRLATRFQHYAVLFEFKDGTEFELAWNPQFDELDGTFELVEKKAAVPAGAYGMDEFTLFFRGDESKPLSARAFLSYGDFFDGDQFQGNLTLLTRFSRFVRSSLSVNRVQIDLPDRLRFEFPDLGAADPNIPDSEFPLEASEFNTTLLQANIGVTFTTRLFADALLQYNTDVDDFSTNLRFNFKYRPGSDIYVVYNERRDFEGLPLDEVDRAFTVKWTYLFSI